MQLSDYFDAAYFINLPTRRDRRTEAERELRRANLTAERFEAVRPSERGEFPNVGTRGCFLSHLGVLKKAHASGAKRLLVLEDDFRFTTAMVEDQTGIVEALEKHPDWAFVWLGNDPQDEVMSREAKGRPWHFEPFARPIALAHCYAVKGEVLPSLIEYLEVMLTRKYGDPKGGPMHYDGACSHYRADHPELLTLLATPPLAVQRASRTDIHQLSLKNRLPVVREFLGLARRVRNRFPL